MSQPLSPAAQAIWDAYETADCDPYEIDPRQAGLAAALRAVANQVVPEEELIMNARGTRHWHRAIQRAETRAAFFAIAVELDGTNPTNQEDYD